MQAGRLDERVEIQTLDDTPTNELGEPAATPWLTQAVRWAEVLTQSGRELLRAQQVTAELTHQVRLRDYPGLTTKHRLKWGESILHIDRIIPEVGGLLLLCIEEG